MPEDVGEEPDEFIPLGRRSFVPMVLQRLPCHRPPVEQPIQYDGSPFFSLPAVGGPRTAGTEQSIQLGDRRLDLLCRLARRGSPGHRERHREHDAHQHHQARRPANLDLRGRRPLGRAPPTQKWREHDQGRGQARDRADREQEAKAEDALMARDHETAEA